MPSSARSPRHLLILAASIVKNFSLTIPFPLQGIDVDITNSRNFRILRSGSVRFLCTCSYNNQRACDNLACSDWLNFSFYFQLAVKYLFIAYTSYADAEYNDINIMRCETKSYIQNLLGRVMQDYTIVFQDFPEGLLVCYGSSWDSPFWQHQKSWLVQLIQQFTCGNHARPIF